MVRLIDADKLIEKFRDFKEWENDNGRPIHTMSEIQRIDRCINFAQMEPTAYDVDKVVEQLKAEESRYKAQALATDDTTDMMRCCMGESVMQTAIEIVKAGGMVSDMKKFRCKEIGMKDRYLYKAKRTDDGEWVQGTLIPCEDGTYKIATSYLEGNSDETILVCAYDVDKTTICQCAGLEDKNGKLIWENDIVSFQRDNDDRPFPNKDVKKRLGKVFWQDFRVGFAIGMGRHGSKSLNDDLWKYVRNGNRVEVIGNIFDNPELLESEE